MTQKIILTALLLLSLTGCTQPVYTLPTPTSTATAASSPINNKIKVDYKERLYDPSGKWTSDQKYPSQITSAEDLIPLYCSVHANQYEGNTYVYFDENNQRFTVQDQKLLDLIAQVKETTPIPVARYCTTENNKTIFIYEIHQGGGGGLNRAIINVLDENNKLTQNIIIKNDGSPYFNCSNPLQLSNNDVFSIGCSGGDGGFSSQSLYNVNLKTNDVTLIKKCTRQANSEGSEYTETCSPQN